LNDRAKLDDTSLMVFLDFGTHFFGRANSRGLSLRAVRDRRCRGRRDGRGADPAAWAL